MCGRRSEKEGRGFWCKVVGLAKGGQERDTRVRPLRQINMAGEGTRPDPGTWAARRRGSDPIRPVSLVVVTRGKRDACQGRKEGPGWWQGQCAGEGQPWAVSRWTSRGAWRPKGCGAPQSMGRIEAEG